MAIDLIAVVLTIVMSAELGHKPQRRSSTVSALLKHQKAWLRNAPRPLCEGIKSCSTGHRRELAYDATNSLRPELDRQHAMLTPRPCSGIIGSVLLGPSYL